MVHSMTAFARVEQAGTHGTLSWELRSVNHRYLEPHLRLPDAFRDLEGAVREALRQGLSRGKVECTLRFAEETAGKSLQVDQERARQLVAAAEGVAAPDPPAGASIRSPCWPGPAYWWPTRPIRRRSTPPPWKPSARPWSNSRPAARAKARSWRSCSTIGSTRCWWKSATCANWCQPCWPTSGRRSSTASPNSGRTRSAAPGAGTGPAGAEERCRRGTGPPRHPRRRGPPGPQAGGAAGRRLDFLMQELNREANTLGSKAFDPRSTQAAVNLKVLIEQMREQVQNIE